MTSVSKNVYIDKSDDIVKKYSNTYHRTIKIKLLDLKPSILLAIKRIHDKDIKAINNKDPKFKIGDIPRISKYENTFAKGHVPNWYEEVFSLQKLKIQFHGHMSLYEIFYIKGE